MQDIDVNRRHWRKLALMGSMPEFLDTLPAGCSSTSAPVMPNGLNHETLSDRSPKPLPKKIPGLIVSGASAAIPCAPEWPIPQARLADIRASLGLFR
jgi:hypothetical protein